MYVFLIIAYLFTLQNKSFSNVVFSVLMVLVRQCYAFVVTILSDEPKQKQWRGLIDRKLVKSPSNFIAGPPKAALLFCFFSDFRCGVPLFIVILVIYIYINR